MCAGRNNSFSLEDSICAGKLVLYMQELDENLELSDSSNACLALNKILGKNILDMLKNSDHGKLLIENGFGEDLILCSKLNNTKVVPFFRENVVKLMPGNNT